jgi:hypothetical protein
MLISDREHRILAWPNSIFDHGESMVCSLPERSIGDFSSGKGRVQWRHSTTKHVLHAKHHSNGGTFRLVSIARKHCVASIPLYRSAHIVLYYLSFVPAVPTSRRSYQLSCLPLKRSTTGHPRLSCNSESMSICFWSSLFQRQPIVSIQCSMVRKIRCREKTRGM